VADKLKQFGEVKYFDVYGDSYVPTKASALPADLTAEKVIAKYIEAIGGAKKIQELKSMKMTMKATIQGGMELTMSSSKKSPGKSLTEVSMQGNVIQKVVSDGKEVAQYVNGGQKVPVDAATREKELFESQFVPETLLLSYNVKAALKGVESVDGKEAYVVEYVLPSGDKTLNYFDKETGYKVQTVVTAKTPQGEVAVPTRFQEYKEVNGVKFPHIIVVSQGPMNFKFEMSKVEVNLTLDDSIFKVQ